MYNNNNNMDNNINNNKLINYNETIKLAKYNSQHTLIAIPKCVIDHRKKCKYY